MKEKKHKNYIIQGNYTSCAAAACQRKLFGYETTGYCRSLQVQMQQKRTISVRSSEF